MSYQETARDGYCEVCDAYRGDWCVDDAGDLLDECHEGRYEAAIGEAEKYYEGLQSEERPRSLGFPYNAWRDQ